MVPRERISPFRPTAAPASRAGHGVEDQGRHRGVPDADARRGDARGDEQLPRRVHEDEADEVPGAEHGGAGHQGLLGADAGDQAARDRGEHHHHQAAGSHPEAGREDRLAEPVAGERRDLQQLRDDDGLGHHAEPDGDRREVREQDRAAGRSSAGRPAGRPAAARTTPRPPGRGRRRRCSRWCGRSPSPTRWPWRCRAGRRRARPSARRRRVTSRRPGSRRGRAGRRRPPAARSGPPSPAATQNRVCQSPTSTIQAESGRPIAPPTPSVALIAAIGGRGHLRRRELADEGDADRDEAHRETLQPAPDEHREQGVRERADQRARPSGSASWPPAPAACRPGRRPGPRSASRRPRPAASR